MRTYSWSRLRDRVVRVLATLSLVAVLAVLGALFVGSAATSQAAPESVTADSQALEAAQGAARDQARPAGVVLSTIVIGGGMLVLGMGAFRPATGGERRELADQLHY